jgi:glycosyltransferase involved in cell wall biosynthesis
VEAGVSALLVKPDDDAGLSDALTRVLTDGHLRVALAKAGLARVRRYDSPIVARQFLEALECGGLPPL